MQNTKCTICLYTFFFKFKVFKYNDLLLLVLFNNKYNALIKISTKHANTYIKNAHFLCFDLYTNKIFVNNCEFILNNLIKQFSVYNFKKIKFLGKGYKIKKITKNSFIFLFNRAHPTILFFKNNFFKKIKKRKIHIKGIGFDIGNRIPQFLSYIRYVSRYTRRGLRISRQVIYKRRGKKL